MISTIGLNTKALKKEPFSGSHHGMRYYLCTKDDVLSVFLYPEPWSFERTPDKEKEKKRLSVYPGRTGCRHRLDQPVL